jgi:cytochrome c peroxidase
MKRELIYISMTTILMSCNEPNSADFLPEISTELDPYEELNEEARQMFAPLPEVAENPDNLITDEKVELGKALYFEERLSKDNTQSCNTCHNLNTYGVDNESFSEGNDGELGGRNSPTTLNSALHFVQFWDGREPDVEAQAGEPILNPIEMAMSSEAEVVKRLSAIDEYKELFAKAFPNEESPITFENIKNAIGAFERKLITPTKFDDYLAGDNSALTAEEKEGLQTFIDAGCTACHTGSLLGGTTYQKFGVYGDYWEFTNSEVIDNGRFDVTNNEADKYVFKVPSLRNIEKTGPYFHDGSVADLGEAIKIMAKAQVDKDLTDKEVDQISAFLSTLTGTVPAELIKE